MTNEIEKIDMTETMPDGTLRFTRLESGAITDKAKGSRIVARDITSEEASAMAKSRWDKFHEAAASAMLKEARAIDPNIKTELDAWAYLIGKQYVAFIDAEKPRGKDLVNFGQIVGAMPTIVDRTAAPVVVNLVNQTIDSGGAKILEKLWSDVRAVQDGKIIDLPIQKKE